MIGKVRGVRVSGGEDNGRRGMATGLMLAGAVSVLALPSAVLAFSTSFNPESASGSSLDSFSSTPADARLASSIPARSLTHGGLFRFTPAGTPTRPDRSVTVAIRVDPQTASAITVRGDRIAEVPTSGAAQLRIAPTAFSLGVARGYQSFVQGLVAAPEIHKIEMPDLKTLRSSSGSQSDGSRFAPRISLDEKQPAGRSPRTFAGDKESRVDVGGSYRLTRNLDVTAGVRYSQERERLTPLTDGNQDNQAVYVGTQFRF